jgi:N-acetylmuramoyl-L-alanine amidase
MRIILTVTMVIYSIFIYSCKSPPQEQPDIPVIEIPLVKYSLLPPNIYQTHNSPERMALIQHYFPQGDIQHGEAPEHPYWSMDQQELISLGRGPYPRVFADFQAVGDFWFLLIQRQNDAEQEISQEIYRLGYKPMELTTPWTLQGFNSSPLDEKLPLIILDPGHGGRDPGSIGANNLAEKTYNQRLAVVVKEELENRGFTVISTYDPLKDQFVSLYDRWRYSSFYGRALFISLHHNSSHNPEDQGFSLFYSSHSKLTEDETAYVMIDGEEKPYISQTISGRDVYLNYLGNGTPQRRHFERYNPDADYYVRSRRPADLALQSFELSLQLYGELKSLDFMNPFSYNNKMIDDRDYQVLANNPNRSVIVEAGFLSNLQEANTLNETDNRRALAQAIARGIETYSSTGTVADLSLK